MNAQQNCTAGEKGTVTFSSRDPEEAVADHSTLSRTRRLVDVETHRAVFTSVLE